MWRPARSCMTTFEAVARAVALGAACALGWLAWSLVRSGPRGRRALVAIGVLHVAVAGIAMTGWGALEWRRYAAWRSSQTFHERGQGCWSHYKRVSERWHEAYWYDERGLMRYPIELPPLVDVESGCCETVEDAWFPYVWVGDSLPVMLARRRDALLLFCPAANPSAARCGFAIRGGHDGQQLSAATLVQWIDRAIAQGESGEVPYTPAAMAALRRELAARHDTERRLGHWMSR